MDFSEGGKMKQLETKDKRAMAVAFILGLILLSLFVWNHDFSTSLEIMVENWLSGLH